MQTKKRGKKHTWGRKGVRTRKDAETKPGKAAVRKNGRPSRERRGKKKEKRLTLTEKHREGRGRLIPMFA